METNQGWVDVAAVDGFPEGAMQALIVDGKEVVVFRVDGNFHALQDYCTHDGGDLSSGTFAAGEITCAWHGARFDVRTGRALSPPAYEDATVVEARCCDDRVQVRLR
ncbi:MAG: non-heme iron oxygenase ferredoxin subunit [Magnetococcales bacterium]|nr:non-heme iron oxygenase ferredoxin subunit [Magnetococcales bacterium]